MSHYLVDTFRNHRLAQGKVVAPQGESAMEMASSPEVRLALAQIPRVAIAARKNPSATTRSYLHVKMREFLDADPDMAAVPTGVLRVKDRSPYFVKLRVQAMKILMPHFSDRQIGSFLRRDRSTIVFWRHHA